MEFEELISHYRIRLSSEAGIALWKINPDICKEDNAPEINLHSVLFVANGELKISVQGKEYVLTKNCFADIIGDQQSLSFLSASTHLQAYHLMLKQEYIATLFKNKPPFSVSYVLNKKINPLSTMDAEHAKLILRQLDDIQQTFATPSHTFRESLLKCKAWIFFMEIANIFIRNEKEEEEEALFKTDRKRMLFIRFLKLLENRIKKEHSVDFYASELCITSQYLRRIVREVSGKTVYEWICEKLIGEIIKLLEDTDMPIQQIADELHFSDQAVLTKFFKRHKGLSPTKYRNR